MIQAWCAPTSLLTNVVALAYIATPNPNPHFLALAYIAAPNPNPNPNPHFLALAYIATPNPNPNFLALAYIAPFRSFLPELTRAPAKGRNM